MRRFFLWMIVVFTIVDGSAQSISRNVVPSVGGSLADGNSMITFTIGEPLTPTLVSSANILTQGFQQPDEQVLSLQGNDVTRLKAVTENNIAKLLYTTKSININKNDYLELERLNNETGQFEVIAHQTMQSDDAILTEYTFFDTEQQEGDNLYRVKREGLDGQITYSEVRKLKYTTPDLITIAPNPAIDYVDINMLPYRDKAANIAILTNFGQLVKQQAVEHVGKSIVRIPLRELANGSYQIRVVFNGKTSFTKKLVIAK